MNSPLRHIKLIAEGDILDSISMGAGGFFVANEESGVPGEDCIYAKLISNGYPGSVLSSVDEKDWVCMNYLRSLFYNSGDVQNIADPNCLKLGKITASCKYIASGDIAINTAIGRV